MSLLLLPITSVLLQAILLVFHRYALAKQRIPYGWYIVGLNVAMGIAALPVFVVQELPTITWQGTHNGWIAAGIIPILACAWNWCYYRAIAHTSAAKVETILLLTPLATLCFGALLVQGDTPGVVWLGMSGATILLILGFQSRHRIRSGSASVLAMGAVILQGLESSVVAYTLDSTTLPPTLIFLSRVAAMTIFFALLLRPRDAQLRGRLFPYMAVSGLLGAGVMITRFYGINSVGIVPTALLMLLSPLAVFGLAATLLKERITTRQLATAGSVLSVVIATVIMSRISS